jgi:glyoxylase-like metal-dependent hydrolase (beta-lactamase superfamily II)
MNTSSGRSWFQHENVYPGITRIWEPHVHQFFRANIWLVEGREADLIVDFGMGLMPLRRSLSLRQGKPVIALATHVHVDHVGSFHEFEERLGHWTEADAFASMPDERTLIDMFRDLPDPVAKLPSQIWIPKNYNLSKAALTRVLYEGDRIELGNFSFEVLHLPGHSPGSIGLLEPSRKILFSGDAVYAGKLVDDVPGADIGQYMKTMNRLSCLDVGVVFAGHNAPISGEEMRLIAKRYILQHSSRQASPR